jgi:hypothetical protein
MLPPGGASQKPPARIPWIAVVSSATPSTIAASTTCPRPDSRAWITAARMPNASSSPPPPKSPSRLSGNSGRSPSRAIAPSAPAIAM